MKVVNLVAILALISQPVYAGCVVSPGFVFDSKHGNIAVSVVRIDALAGPILHYRADSEINTDGSVISYHLDGTSAGALNSICNASNAVLSDGTIYAGIVTDAERASPTYKRLDVQGRRAFGRDKCNRLLGYFAQARRTGFDPAVRPKMDFYAIAKRPDGRPCLTAEGFFVSQTKAQADPSISDNCDPAKWLDPLKISAVVIPRGSTFTTFPGYGIDSGNLVLARTSGSFIQAVVGDKGPHRGLGEITPHLGWQLNGVQPDPATLPLGQIRDQLARAHVRSVEYFVFPQTTVGAAPGALVPDPAKRRPVRIDSETIAAAFSRLDLKAVEADLNSCNFDLR